jgi:hypothetical protein
VFFIKINVKVKLANLTENKEELINTNGIKNSNIISYVNDNIKHKLILDNNKITLLRENNEFSHGILFEENKTNSSEYYLKESKYSIEFNIETIKLILDNNKIDITYKILESENIYNYVLEVSDNL